MDEKGIAPITRRHFLKQALTALWGLVLAACRPQATFTPAPEATRTLTPTHTQTLTQTPTATPVPSLDDLGRALTLFGADWFVPVQDQPLADVLAARYGGQADLAALTQDYVEALGVDILYAGTFYPLPPLTTQGTFPDPLAALTLELAGYDRWITLSGREVPLFTVARNQYAAQVGVMPVGLPLGAPPTYALHYYDMQTGTVKGVYLDYEGLSAPWPDGPLTLAMLGYANLTEFQAADADAVADRVQTSLAWEQEVIAYGPTRLAVVFPGLDLTLPFLLDKALEPTSESGEKPDTPTQEDGGPTTGGTQPTSTPTPDDGGPGSTTSTTGTPGGGPTIGGGPGSD